MNRRRKGKIGSSLVGGDPIQSVRKKISVELELRRLGKKPKPSGHDHRLNVLRKINSGAADKEYWYWLIDYRDGNRRILKKAMTHLEAFHKNRFLEGTGKAWARAGV